MIQINEPHFKIEYQLEGVATEIKLSIIVIYGLLDFYICLNDMLMTARGHLMAYYKIVVILSLRWSSIPNIEVPKKGKIVKKHFLPTPCDRF